LPPRFPPSQTVRLEKTRAMHGHINSPAPIVRLPELDGLRALAILLVLFSHHLAYVPNAELRHIVETGWVGVDLFFVLSGFLIGGILLDHRTATNYYPVFYLRRFLRIVPLYALLVLPGLIVLGCGLQAHFSGHSLAGQSAVGMWLCVGFMQNIGSVCGFGIPGYLGPTWSVAVEEQFYLLLPPLVRKLNVNQLVKILIAAILFAPLLRGILIYWFHAQAAEACYVLLPCRWDSLLLGVVTAIAWRNAVSRQWIIDRLRAAQIIWWLLAFGSIALLCGSGDRLDPKLGFLGYTLIDLWFAITLLLAVINPQGRLHRGLSLSAFKPIATISYGLYLLQSPMMAVVETAFRVAHISYAKISWTATGVAMISLAATFVAAAVSWRFFESRMIRLGHQHRYVNAVKGGSDVLSPTLNG
jgi:peptidoglycan/LPS O-acetylase OafA/YrhL